MNESRTTPSPLVERDDFTLNVEQGTLVHKNPYYKFSLRPKGYIPKSGLLLRDYLLALPQQVSSALEIGVGELAFIPISLIMHKKAKTVDCFEADDLAITWAKKNISHNRIEDKILVYKDWSNALDKKYDLIYSNPPQMPVEVNRSLHDDGGKDGYQVIRKIIDYAKNHLEKNGTLVLLVFDFLNAERSYNNKETLLDILGQNGLYGTVKNRFLVKIRSGGKTEKQLDWIRQQYPLFNFQIDGSLGHSTIIIEARLGQ